MTPRVPSVVAPRPLPELIAAVEPVDETSRLAALQRHDTLVKPPGSLGRLEAVGAQLAAISRQCPAPVPQLPWLLLAAADHGVHAEAVNAWPQEVTAAVVATACQGRSVSAALAAQAGIAMSILDVGLAHDPGEHPSLLRHAVRPGTRNLAVEDAMTTAEVETAIGIGGAVAEGMIRDGADLLLLGEMGMTNTTASAALICAMTGADAEHVTGRGAGADDATLARKIDVVASASARCAGRDPLQTLAAVGGLEHAALVGGMLTAAAHRLPIVLDGMITNAAALVAVALQPALRHYLVASHVSAEPGAAVALDALGLEPLLDLDLRLGEGTGALLATPLVAGAAAVLANAATIDSIT